MPKTRIGVILSGCGVFDGAEIHESVITLLALDRLGAEALICAPDIEQMHVINHLNGEVAQGETRNVLVESARIARGEISEISKVGTDQLDGLILPGGFGAAKNLCDFAVKGAECAVHPEVRRLVSEVHAAGKPVAALCIAPALLAKILGAESPEVTIGNDAETALALEALGAKHVQCAVSEMLIDEKRKLITSPAYMIGQRISEVAAGIEKTVAALIKMT